MVNTTLEELETRDVPAAVFYAMTDTLRAFDQGGHEIWSVRPFATFQGDVNITSGDVNGDNTPDVIIGAGAGGGPHVRVLSGIDGSELMSFYAYDPNFTGGVFVAATDVNGDRRAEIITGAGAGGGPHVEVWDGSGSILQSFYAGPVEFHGGVRVAASGSSVQTELVRLALDSRPLSVKRLYLSFGKDAPVELIPRVFQQVSGYFAPYNINVTTVQPTGPASLWNTVIIGGSGTAAEGWLPGDFAKNADGFASINSSAPAYVFAGKIGWNNPVVIARAIAHEAGHSFGLDHVHDVNSIMNDSLRDAIGGWDSQSDTILGWRLGRI